MSESVVWVDPPDAGPTGSKRGVWIARLEPFLERPGEWGQIVHENGFAPTTVTALSKRVPKMPPGRWEFTGRTRPEGNRVDIWARYLGPEDESK